MLQLAIGNKNYSSWSLRAWLLLRQAGIPFEEIKLRLDLDAGSPFKQRLAALGAPTGKVPLLLDDGFAVWDTLAIAEYVAERFPQHQLWPADAKQRARARSLCAEMHSGFGALRSACPMNIEAPFPEVGKKIWAGQADVRADVQRIDAAWSALLAEHGGPFLFGERFGVIDAFFAPVASRLRSFALPVSAAALAYVDHLHQLAAFREWTQDALAEADFIAFDEPYRTHR
ncbi:MAG: glutathione S-transferase family protein [Aquabacterium sp.]|nr:MAG: glutathione S-transferase family protein [Aquabacterium sp.]